MMMKILLKTWTLVLLFPFLAYSLEVLIDDFESYEVGEGLAGQGEWEILTNTCNPYIEDIGGEFGQTVRSGDCFSGQRGRRDYDFGFTSNSISSVWFQGRILDGFGNNCAAILNFGGGGVNGIGFGIRNNASIGVNHQAFLVVGGVEIHGAQLVPGQWYDLRVDIDWTYVSNDGFIGLCTFRYKELNSNDWIIEPVFQDKEVRHTDPTLISGLGLVMDGFSSRRGEIDNIYYTTTVVSSSEERLREENTISIFPNPCYDQLSIQTDLPLSNEASVEIFDMQGRMVQKNPFMHSILIGDLNPGMYILSISHLGQVYRQSFIKLAH